MIRSTFHEAARETPVSRRPTSSSVATGRRGGAAALAAARSGARTRLIEVHGCLGGRCISGDFYAHASYRVTGNSVATGEAAGALAAVSVQERALPHEAPWPTVARALERLHVGPSG